MPITHPGVTPTNLLAAPAVFAAADPAAEGGKFYGPSDRAAERPIDT